MVRWPWAEIPDFWRDRGVFAWRSILALLVIAECIGLWFAAGWSSVVALLVLAASGVESILYWWLLPVFRISQERWWKKPEQAFGGWFDYPPEASWLKALPPYWFWKITRSRVYATAGAGAVIAIILVAVWG